MARVQSKRKASDLEGKVTGFFKQSRPVGGREPKEATVNEGSDRPLKRRRLTYSAEEGGLIVKFPFSLEQALGELRPCAPAFEAVLPDPAHRLEPYGVPRAWAEDRSNLCETIPQYRSYESGPYFTNGLTIGALIDEDNDGRSYMDDEIIITRCGGDCASDKKDGGRMKPSKSQTSTQANIKAMINSMERKIPILVILGSKNVRCLTKPLHRYSVLGWFHCVQVWAEKSNGFVHYKQRLEKIELHVKSWWAPVGTPNPPATRKFKNRAFRGICAVCDAESPQIYANGWMCMNGECKEHFKLGDKSTKDLKYNAHWIYERTAYHDIDALPSILPPMPDPEADSVISTKRNMWRGIVCPKCGRCNSRIYWDFWRCATSGCDFILPVKHGLRSPHSLLADHQVEDFGRPYPFNDCSSPATELPTEYVGWWSIHKYRVGLCGSITHFAANEWINRQRGGGHEMLKELQQADLGLKRHKFGTCDSHGNMTAHFSANFGMPYKFVVAVDSRAFKEAPAVIIDALNRMSWAGRYIVGDKSFKQFNELLALGYFEKSKINYHDDGEDDLDGSVATISIGSDATMCLRMKDKYYSVHKLKENSYNPRTELEEGMQGYEARCRLRELHRNGHLGEYEKAKSLFFQDIKQGVYGKAIKARDCCTIKLKHGDITVMDGRKLQKFYEHAVTPLGELRFALTCRYIKPANIDVKEHWKADFSIPDADKYDGEPNLLLQTKLLQAATAAAETSGVDTITPSTVNA